MPQARALVLTAQVSRLRLKDGRKHLICTVPRLA